ncbi:glycosyltransferase family 2 protein [Streptomyces sp. NPDC102406]|uniref:glycosyltransferase family 2 protein n=1 Tax=Streptomyces sp. NPDC102406 TaxID=3366171 RepID=UPI0037FEA85F
MTTHDCRDATLAALDALAAQRDLPTGTRVRVHLVDAGSTDGTAHAVRRAHPDVQVTVVGPDVRWGEGMRLASRNSRAAGIPEPTHQLWLGDDVLLAPDALARLLEVSAGLDEEAVVVGAVRHGTATTRSGRRRRGRALDLVEPGDRPEPCDTYDGDVVLLPWAVRERVGDIDKAFPHGMGDYDHGLRARHAGIRAYVAPHHVGEGPRDPAPWPDLPLGQWWVYCRRHGGVRAPVLMVSPCAVTVVRALTTGRATP